MLRAHSLRCEYLTEPLGLDNPAPRLSWVLDADGAHDVWQAAYQILVGRSPGGDDLWDSGRVESGETAHVVYGGPPPADGERAYWQVRVWERTAGSGASPPSGGHSSAIGTAMSSRLGTDEPGPWSAPTWWEAGLRAWDPNAAWIGPPPPPAEPVPFESGTPARLFRRSFHVDAPVVRARLYATALGLYDARINGSAVSPTDDRFAPGWTDYPKRLAYQAYDVGELVLSGENVLGLTLADGWYAGWVGFTNEREHYGRSPAARAQLVLDHADGTRTVVATDGEWRMGEGRIRSTDFLKGESFDARLNAAGWDRPGFDAVEWSPAPVLDRAEVQHGPLVSTLSPLPRPVEELAPASVVEHRPGVFIFDMAQNMVGWVRLRVRGPAGTEVTLRFAEVLEADGSLHTANLRGARSVDTYVLDGSGDEVWEPKFTFHGFRYVEVTGYPGLPGLDAVTGVVCGSPLDFVGEFECSDPLVNQLHRNIVWGQRGNFLEVPTDCPQRDERLGWMGDAQVFGRTAFFNMDVGSFFTKWMHDVVDGQTPEGAFPDVAPKLVDPQDGMPGWGDAGVIMPWLMYERYGDRVIIEEHLDAMARWVDYIHRANPGLLWVERRNGDVGDWLNIDADSPKDVISTSFFALSAELVGRMAAVVGRSDVADRYRTLADQVKAAYCEAYVKPDGRIEGDTQAVYALALRFDLLPADLRQAAGDYLAADVARRGDRLSTGFLGVSHLLPALTQTGHVDVAYRLLHQREWPSWLYPVLHGATTIWERWNGWTEEDGLFEPGMNSFNHYAFGSVGEWLYETAAGLRPDPDAPGYAHFFVEPHPGAGLDWVSLRHQSIRGPISVRWERVDGGSLRLDVTVPPNTSATVRLPDGAEHGVGSGSHSFTAAG